MSPNPVTYRRRPLGAEGQVVTFSGTHTLSTGATLTGPGTMRQTGGTVLVSGSATMKAGRYELNDGSLDGGNRAGGVFDTTGPVSLGGAGRFTNEGTFRRSGVAGTTDVTVAQFDNHGTVEVLAGNVNLGGGANDGAFRTAVGATLTLAAEHGFETGARFAGPGHVIARSVVDVRGAVSTSAETTFSLAGTGTVDGPGTFLVHGTLIEEGGMRGAVRRHRPGAVQRGRGDQPRDR